MHKRISVTLPQILMTGATALAVILILIADITILTNTDVTDYHPADRFTAVFLPVIVDLIFITLLVLSCIEFCVSKFDILKVSMMTVAMSCEEIIYAFIEFADQEKYETIAAILYLVVAALGIGISISTIYKKKYFSDKSLATLKETRILYALAFALSLEGTRIYGSSSIYFNYFGLALVVAAFLLTELEARDSRSKNGSKQMIALLIIGVILLIVSLTCLLAFCLNDVTQNWNYPWISSSFICMALSPVFSSISFITLGAYMSSKQAIKQSQSFQKIPISLVPPTNPQPVYSAPVQFQAKVKNPSGLTSIQQQQPMFRKPNAFPPKQGSMDVAKSRHKSHNIKLSILVVACITALVIGSFIGMGSEYGILSARGIASANASLKTKQQQVDKLNQKISSLNDRYETAKATVDKANKLSGSINELTSKQKDLQNKVNQLNQQYDQQKGKPIQLPAGTFTVGKEVPAGRYIIKGSSNFATFLDGDTDINTILGNDEGGSGDYHGDLLNGERIENDAPATLVPVQ